MNITSLGSGCVTFDSAVASDTRGHGFEASQEQLKRSHITWNIQSELQCSTFTLLQNLRLWYRHIYDIFPSCFKVHLKIMSNFRPNIVLQSFCRARLDAFFTQFVWKKRSGMASLKWLQTTKISIRGIYLLKPFLSVSVVGTYLTWRWSTAKVVLFSMP